MPVKKVLLVGTTTDYIDIIARRYPGRALFITDHKERESAWEAPPVDGGELLCDLTKYGETTAKLREYLDRHKIELNGVVCFDDESLAPASYIASAFALRYPSASAVANSRSKFLSRRLWNAAGLPCPQTALIGSADEAVEFHRRIKAPVVVKPLTGSGSELTFACRTDDECRSAFDMVAAGLENRTGCRLYSTAGGNIVIEEFIGGDEYSTDFMIDGNRLEIIRVARKIMSGDGVFGTAMGYMVPADLPESLNLEKLSEQFGKAVRSLGIMRSLCMIDFIVREDKAVMLETAPRPGGDNIPFLIHRSCGFDILGAALDFAEGKEISIPAPGTWKRLIGARIMAVRDGIITGMDISQVTSDSRYREHYFKRHPGHRVTLPPDDYDSRILGHVIFEPNDWDRAREETSEILEKIIILQDRAPCKATPIC